MAFNSEQFAIFIFISCLIYYIIPQKFQWIILLSASIYFYSQVGIYSLIFLCFIALITYLSGILIHNNHKSGKKIILSSSIIIFVALLTLMRTKLSFVSSIIVPTGLSFYSLNCLGYIIDVSRGSTEVEKNPLRLLLYISYFPHIIQGPFENHKELNTQLRAGHAFDYENAARAMIRICYGLMKKTIIADRISNNIIDGIYADPSETFGITIFIVMILYTIQLYADFSGYMDITVGVSNLFGIQIQENFNVPYLSKSMAEFWRRWHMSLGLWFKNYVFFPVQRSALVTKIRTSLKKKNKYLMNTIPSVLGLLCVWTLIGLWHGFDWNYLLYDWLCGAIIIFSEILKPAYTRFNKKFPKLSASVAMDIFRVLRTFIIVNFSFLLFRPDTVQTSIVMCKNLFSSLAIYKGAEFIYWNSYELFLIVPALIIVIVVDIYKYKGINVLDKFRKINPVLRYAIYIIGIVYLYVARNKFGSSDFAYAIF